MALHTDTEIYKATYALCQLVTQLVAGMPRNYKADFGADLRKGCMTLVRRTYQANVREDKAPVLQRMREEVEEVNLVGNLSSQFFANVLLNEVDQHVKHQIRAQHYTRYVDDMVLLHKSPQWLNTALDGINAFLPGLGLALNPRKTIIQPIHRGIDYVGHTIKPWCRTTRPRTLHAALNRLERMPDADVYASGNSYLGLVRQASHSHNAQAKVCRALLKRGHAVDGMHLEKAFRKHQ